MIPIYFKLQLHSFRSRCLATVFRTCSSVLECVMKVREKKISSVGLVLILGLVFGISYLYYDPSSDWIEQINSLLWDFQDNSTWFDENKYYPVREEIIEVEESFIYTRVVGKIKKSFFSVLLLHGKGFDSSTWQKVGTMRVLAEAGYHAIAVDLPSFGRSELMKYLITPERFFELLLPALQLNKPVIVSPSISGIYTLPYVLYQPEEVTGYIPISPLISPAFTEEDFQMCSVPTLIFYGKNDIGAQQTREILSQMPNSNVKILSNATHSCYVDNPRDFHSELISFLNSLK